METESITAPTSTSFKIVIITQGQMRHKRFAYRIQQEFGSKVVGWFEVKPVSASGVPIAVLSLWGKIKRVFDLLSPKSAKSIRVTKNWTPMGALRMLKRVLLRISVLRVDRLKKRGVEHSERKILGPEMKSLEKFKVCEPMIIHDHKSEEFIEKIRELNPYFILTLGGPLYPRELIASASGFAINQHAGWAPQYKGNATVYWALFHRQLNYLGSTVHLLSTGADSGAILRRGNPCVLPSDSPFDCFVRVVVLGNELMIETVREIITNGKVRIQPQVEGEGKTYLSKEFTHELTLRLLRDFKSGWLKMELNRVKT